MENPSVKHMCLLSSKKNEISHSVNIKLALTEENLDYLLRQEYTLSHMCYKADQLTLEALAREDNIIALKNREKTIADQDSIKNNISDDKLDVEQEGAACREYTIIQNKSDVKLSAIKPKKVDVEFISYISLDSFCQGEYNFKGPTESEKKIDYKFKKRGKAFSIATPNRKELEDKRILLSNASKNIVVFKTINLMSISRALKSYKILHLNYNMNILQVKHSLQTYGCLKLFVNEIFGKETKETTRQYRTNYGMYQNLMGLLQSLLLKEYIDFNMAVKNKNHNQFFIEENTNKFSSKKDLALSPISLHNTHNFNCDAINLGNSTSEIICSDIYSTAFNNTALNNNKIMEIDSLATYTDPIENEATNKSNLKRKISAQASTKRNKLKRSGLKFTNVTTFYFERSQGFSSVPTKGGSTLGMAKHHFHMNTLAVDEHEHRKMQREAFKRRTTNTMYRKFEAKERARSIQALNLSQRIDLLQSAEIQIEVKEEDDCAHIRSSRALAGCDCKDYCDPDICSCNLAGIECQVDRQSFPCGCSKENCRNVMGRNEYNHSKVRSHYTKTIRKIKLEGKGRISKRKQASPSKIFIYNNNETDIDMIEV